MDNEQQKQGHITGHLSSQLTGPSALPLHTLGAPASLATAYYYQHPQSHPVISSRHPEFPTLPIFPTCHQKPVSHLFPSSAGFFFDPTAPTLFPPAPTTEPFPPAPSQPIPSNTQPTHSRQLISCDFCRIRKLKCDGSRPCGQCVKKHNTQVRKRLGRREGDENDDGGGKTKAVVECHYQIYVRTRGKGKKQKKKSDLR